MNQANKVTIHLYKECKYTKKVHKYTFAQHKHVNFAVGIPEINGTAKQ